ncbi:anti-sigma factor [Streptomyces tanashiensis]|uniref:anti-sigma factor n=1 Tax=Streptomyces tanashiensis TaxID=67367 RepID=UPI00344A67FC
MCRPKPKLTATPRPSSFWYAADNGGLRPAGLVPGSGQASARLLAGPLRDTTAVGITVEPAGGSAQPTSEPLGITSLGTASGLLIVSE